jgi:ubiquinone/menaquinone biosynthesis C-methylase UbiE
MMPADSKEGKAMVPALTFSVNHWPDSKCAKAFWGQQELPPYRGLLTDTSAWLFPQPGDRWLDLGCGCGQLTQAIWKKSAGSVAEVVGLDCAPANVHAFEKLRAALRPAPAQDQLHFLCSNFSKGLARWQDGYFDGVVSGLAIQYAESYSKKRGCWTADAYDQLLADIFRVLRSGGWFVFSVNVPHPAWMKVAFQSLTGVLSAQRPAHYLKNAWRMLRYGSWLTREAEQGRFHYLPLSEIVRKLTSTGFYAIEHQITYAGQAYLIRCRKPA